MTILVILELLGMLPGMSIFLKQPNEDDQKNIRILIPEKNNRIEEAVKRLTKETKYQIVQKIPNMDVCKKHIREAISKKNFSEDKNLESINHISMQSSAALKLGFIDAVVIGSEVTTADVIRSGLWLGLKSSKLISSSFLMAQPESKQVIMYADCGVNIDPDHEQLAEIATQSIETWKHLQKETPKLAFLSFSTKGSAKHACVEKIQKAQQLFCTQNPEVSCDGELQFDAAWSDEIRKQKAPNSKLSEPANCFVFPSLDAGNIAYKITQQLAGYHAFGPILQGFSKPLMDLSRGSTPQDIVYTAKIAGALSKKNHQGPKP